VTVTFIFNYHIFLWDLFHFLKFAEEHGSLNLFIAQGMEHSNKETKEGFMRPTKRQRQRVMQKGIITLSRVGHNMNLSLQLARHMATHGPKRQWQQVNHEVVAPHAATKVSGDETTPSDQGKSDKEETQAQPKHNLSIADRPSLFYACSPCKASPPPVLPLPN
jgi:hypothetical protein